jgi:hypothetical protein
VRRLTRRATREVDDALSALVDAMRQRLGVTRGVRVLESALVGVPTVVGCIRPVLLLPGSLVTGLPAAHLEAVIAHELAHVRRYDFLVNAAQVAIETILFYHPAVWWCSRQIRIEREHCCDDMVVAACGDRLAYATALTSLEELRHVTSALALSATGGRLVDRIRRVLASSHGREGRSPAWVIVAGFATVLVLIVSAPALTDRVAALAPMASEDQRPPAPPRAPQPPAPAAVPAPPAPQAPLAPGAPPLLPDVDWADYVRETQAALEALARALPDLPDPPELPELPGFPDLPEFPEPPEPPAPLSPGPIQAIPAVPAPPAAPAPLAIPAPTPAPAPQAQNGLSDLDRAIESLQRARAQLETMRQELVLQQERLREHERVIERQRQNMQRMVEQIEVRSRASADDASTKIIELRKLLEEAYRKQIAETTDKQKLIRDTELMQLRKQLEELNERLR